jgi:hypothetical protein
VLSTITKSVEIQRTVALVLKYYLDELRLHRANVKLIIKDAMT